MTAVQLGPQSHSYVRLYDQPEPKLKLTPRTIGAFTAVAMLYAGGGMLLNMAGIEFPIPTILDRTVVMETSTPETPAKPIERPITPTEVVRPKDDLTPITEVSDPVPPHAPLDMATGETAGPIFNDTTTDAGPIASGTAATPEPVAPAPAMIRSPAWLSRPTAAQLDRLYPDRAADRGLSGMVNLECRVTAQGTMSACVVLNETPLKLGFGEAALASTKYFRMSPLTVDGAPIEGAKVRIPMGFNIGE